MSRPLKPISIADLTTRLADGIMRQRRGLIERTQRPCICCSRPFGSTGYDNRVCDTCRGADGKMEFEK